MNNFWNIWPFNFLRVFKMYSCTLFRVFDTEPSCLFKLNNTDIKLRRISPAGVEKPNLSKRRSCLVRRGSSDQVFGRPTSRPKRGIRKETLASPTEQWFIKASYVQLKNFTPIKHFNFNRMVLLRTPPVNRLWAKSLVRNWFPRTLTFPWPQRSSNLCSESFFWDM